jgi:hypothetical protein
LNGDELAVALAAGPAERDLAPAGEVIGSDRIFACEQFVERTLAHHFAAVDSGAGPHVDDMVGMANGVLVMLDDEHGVAEGFQALQGFEKAVVVLLVEADRGLVEDIKDAREAGADLTGETDALALAARERAAGAIEVKIVEPDIVEKAQSLVDLLEDRLGDFVLGRVELFVESTEPCEGVGDGTAGGHGDILACDLHRERFGLETGAVADLARAARLVAAKLLAHPGALGLRHSAVEVADDTLERLFHFVAALAVDEAEGDGSPARAAKDHVASFLGELRPGRFEVEVVGARKAGEDLHVVRGRRIGLGPRDDGALLEGERVIGDDEVLVKHQLLAEAVARGAGALRRVEGEEPGLDLGDGEAGYRTSEFLGEDDPPGRCVVELHSRGRNFGARQGIGWIEEGETFGELQRRFKAVGEPGLDAFANDDAVDHDLDVMLVLLVERGRFFDRVELAVDPDPREAGFLPLGEFFSILALSPADDRSEEIMAAALREGHYSIDHLADLLGFDRKAGRGRIGHPDARPQEAHVIVDFGDGGDGRARVAAGGLLLDRDCGREPVDMLDVGLLHHLEELARVGGERLHISPLPPLRRSYRTPTTTFRFRRGR